MEQKSDFDYDRQSNAIMNAAGIRSNTDYKKVDTIIDIGSGQGDFLKLAYMQKIAKKFMCESRKHHVKIT